MDLLLYSLFTVCLACACCVLLAMFSDDWALKSAAIIKARVEARAAYRERYAAALARIEGEMGVAPR